jgi:hypothetical protein
VKRYKLNPIIIAPPNKGFLIQTPTGKTLFDTVPRGIVKELNRLNDRINKLEEAGDALCENSNPSRWDSPTDAARKMIDQSNWFKAKEAKS